MLNGADHIVKANARVWAGCRLRMRPSPGPLERNESGPDGSILDTVFGLFGHDSQDIEKPNDERAFAKLRRLHRSWPSARWLRSAWTRGATSRGEHDVHERFRRR